jgi:iron complex transport system substrate-binding protein
MKKIIKTAVLALAIMVSLTACSPKDQQTGSKQQKNTAKEESSNLPTKDRSGNEIKVPGEIDSIISMAPSMTEILIDLGYGDKIVAADTQSKAVEGLPEGIAYIDMMAPDAEKIIALKPDIIFVSEMSNVEGNNPFKPIVDAGICVAYIPSSYSIESIYGDIMFIADVVQAHSKGQELVDIMKDKIAEIKKIGDTIKDKKTVYFEIAAAPDLVSFGNGVFLDEMINIIGAVNVLSDQESWIAISEEKILAANPDVIITNVNYIDKPVEEIMSRSGWENINAVKNKNVYYVDNMSSSLPDHNIVKALEEMAEAIYPDKY